MIKSCSLDIVEALNGTEPMSMAYRQTPALHMSTLKPTYPSSSKISGAIYAGVPHYSFIDSRPVFSYLETPKSHILTFPVASSKIFSSLMSRCTTFFALWMYASPSTSCLKKKRATSSLSLLRFLMYEKRSPPEHSSITKQMCLEVSNVSKRRTTFGWLHCLRIPISSLVRLR